MPKLTITLDLSQAQIDFIATSLAGKPTPRTLSIKDVEESFGPQPGVGRGFTPDLPSSPWSYKRSFNERSSVPGRPMALTTDGMKLVWRLWNDGHSVPEISRAFAGVVDKETIRRLIKRVAKAGGTK